MKDQDRNAGFPAGSQADWRFGVTAMNGERSVMHVTTGLDARCNE